MSIKISFMGDGVLYDTLDGLHAYDVGSYQSGIHDEDRRSAVIAWLNSLNRLERQSRLMRCFDQRLKDGTWEDVGEFATWLHEQGVQP